MKRLAGVRKSSCVAADPEVHSDVVVSAPVVTSRAKEFRSPVQVPELYFDTKSALSVAVTRGLDTATAALEPTLAAMSSEIWVMAFWNAVASPAGSALPVPPLKAMAFMTDRASALATVSPRATT